MIPLHGPIFVVLAATLWAIDALIRTPLTQRIPAVSIVFFEHLFGLIILSPLFVRSLPVLKKINLKTWVAITILTLVSSIGGTVLFTQALGASFATGDFITPLLLQKLQPIIVLLLSLLILKEKPNTAFFLWMPLALIGGYLMSFGFNIPQLSLSGKELVVLLSLGATACWGTGTIISKTLLNKFSSRDTTFLRFLVAVPLSFGIAMLSKQMYSFAQFTLEDLLRFIAIALSTGAVALFIYYLGLKKTPAHVATLLELVFPLTSILIGITSLNPYGAPQQLTYQQMIGILLLTISVVKISFLSKS
jgi:drug/metabolite transporter, DME family